MNSTKPRFAVAAGIGLAAIGANAQQLSDNYVGKGYGRRKIAEMISALPEGEKMSAGQSAASKATIVAAGGNAKVSFGKPEAYLLRVKQGGTAVRMVKLVAE